MIWFKQTMKFLKYSYMFLWILVIPVIIGKGVGDLLEKIYHNFNEHLLAGIAVCFFSGAVVTWVPMVFVVEEVGFREKDTLLGISLLLWVAGIIAPLLFGFQQLGMSIAILLIFSAAFTVTKVLSAISEISKKLDRYRDENIS